MKVSYRFAVIAALFVTCLITANIIAVKIFTIGIITLPAAVIIFPFSYIFGDILTEVYGYAQARRVIWLGFLCNLIFVVFAWLGQILPPAGFWQGQSDYESILGYTWRLLIASFLAYIVGEFANSAIMARMKVWTKGKNLWARTIGSTIVGQGLDSAIFITVAFYATVAFSGTLILQQWIAKVAIEVLATPLTYLAVNYLKKVEGQNPFDAHTNLNPFRFTSGKNKNGVDTAVKS
jgi:queuosine precursor transporter